MWLSTKSSDKCLPVWEMKDAHFSGSGLTNLSDCMITQADITIHTYEGSPHPLSGLVSTMFTGLHLPSLWQLPQTSSAHLPIPHGTSPTAALSPDPAGELDDEEIYSQNASRILLSQVHLHLHVYEDQVAYEQRAKRFISATLRGISMEYNALLDDHEYSRIVFSAKDLDIGSCDDNAVSILHALAPTSDTSVPIVQVSLTVRPSASPNVLDVQGKAHIAPIYIDFSSSSWQSVSTYLMNMCETTSLHFVNMAISPLHLKGPMSVPMSATPQHRDPLSKYDQMDEVLTFSPMTIRNITGWPSLVREVVTHWQNDLPSKSS